MLKALAERRKGACETPPCPDYEPKHPEDWGYVTCRRCGWAEPEHVIDQLRNALVGESRLRLTAEQEREEQRRGRLMDVASAQKEQAFYRDVVYWWKARAVEAELQFRRVRESALALFAREVLDGYATGVVGDVDGGWLQERAFDLGLLVPGSEGEDPNFYLVDWLKAVSPSAREAQGSEADRLSPDGETIKELQLKLEAAESRSLIAEQQVQELQREFQSRVEPMGDGHDSPTARDEPSASDDTQIARAIRTVLRGFDERVFVRSIAEDDRPDWAIRLFPFIHALGVLESEFGPCCLGEDCPIHGGPTSEGL